MNWPIARPYPRRAAIVLAVMIVVVAVGVGVVDHAGLVATWWAALALVVPVAVTLILAVEHSIHYVISPEGVSVRGFMTKIELQRWNIVNACLTQYRPGRPGPTLSGIGLRMGAVEMTPFGPASFYGGRNVQPAVLLILDDGSRTLLTPEAPRRFLDTLEKWGYPIDTDAEREAEEQAWTA